MSKSDNNPRGKVMAARTGVQKIGKGAIPVSSKLDMRLMDSMTATYASTSASVRSVRASSLPTNGMPTTQSQARGESGSGRRCSG